MKKIILLFLLSCLYFKGFAQSTTAATYALSTQTATYTSVSGGTTTGPADLDDGTTTGVNIGFSFKFCSTTYTQLSVNQNGLISLRNITGTGNTYTNTTAELNNIGAGVGVLMPFWDDITQYPNGTNNSTACSGVIGQYITTGSAPNRVFTFEWFNFGAYNTGTQSGCGSIEVKLYETTNIIEFCYGSNSFANMSATIGIANSNADFKVVTSNTAFPTTSTSTFTATLTTTPATSIVYRWCPQNINPTATNGGPYCSGLTAALAGSATAGASYSWAGPNSFTASVQNPTIPNVTVAAAGVYTLTETIGTCMANNITTMTINPTPPKITGSDSVCVGSTTALTDATAGGTWSSATLAVATITAGGVVRGVSAGNSVISYTIAATGCDTTITMRVQNPPSAGSISGTNSFCQGTTQPMTDPAAGGVWSSTNTAVATIDASGNLTGVSGGTTVVSYTVTNSCGPVAATMNVTINPLPAPGPITGTTTFCSTGTTTLSDAGGGSWTSASPAVATVDASGLVTGVSAGTAVISYGLTNACGTVYATTTVTTESLITPVAISGGATVCVGASTPYTDATSGGIWSSSSLSNATVDFSGNVFGVAVGSSDISYSVTNTCGTGTVTQTVTVIDVPVVAPITGTTNVCPGSTVTLADATSGGGWSSSDGTLATVDAAGVVTGVATGAITINYTVSNACGPTTVNTAFTINPLPNAGTITGGLTVCPTATSLLSDAVSGGVWASADPSIATVDASSGLVTGVSAGTTFISYTFTNSCGSATTTTSFDVFPAPNAGTISGATAVCLGSTTGLTDGVAGGVWTTADASIASVNSSGTVTGVAVGSTTITYTTTNSCGSAFTTAPMTVNTSTPSGGVITGTFNVCIGAVTTLADATSGGSWTSGNTAIATVDASGNVTGVSAGSATITYTVTTSCGTGTATQAVTVNAPPVAAAITGVAPFCVGNTITLSDATAGGVWATANSAIASVDGSGNVTGVSGGTTTISYTVTTSCGTSTSTASVNVLTTPSAGTISGSGSVCVATTTSLTSTVGGGAWSSASAGVATVDPSTGLVTGVSVGSTTITYTVTNICGSNNTTTPVTVNSSTSAGSITGPGAVCIGSTITLADAVSGGAWMSSNTSVATITGGGVVTGVSVGSTVISYIVSGLCGVGVATSTITVSTSAVAGVITGLTTVCTGTTITLADGISGGVWTSSQPAVATIDPSTGVVTGVTAGADTIYYTVTNACGNATTSFNITSSTSPTAGTITGSPAICIGTSVTLADAVAGGTWSSSNSAVATISSTGVVTGLTNGSSTISYTVVTSCGTAVATQVVASSAFPNAGTIIGSSLLCVGSTGVYTDTAVGGVWSSSNTSIATVDATGNVTGVATGAVNIYYSVTNGCGSTNVTISLTIVNPPSTGTIGGSSSLCIGNTATLTETVSGGTWSSSNPSIASIDASGNVAGIASGSTTISYGITSSCGVSYATMNLTVAPGAYPGVIGGTTTVCPGAIGVLTETVSGTWSISNPAIATVSATGVLTGVSAGTAVVSYSATAACGSTSTTDTVHVLPSTTAGIITGTTSTCVGATTLLTDTVSGGTWSSSNTAKATVTSSGLVTGVDTGMVVISYTVSGVCGAAGTTIPVTIINTPYEGIISGVTALCQATSTTLSESVSGGTWSSGNPSVATASSTGVVTGVSGGSVIISYTVSNVCGMGIATAFLTVNPLPDSGVISGSAAMCVGVNTTLSETVSGGTWSSSNSSVATISTTGVVTPLSIGTATISYGVVNGCGTTHAILSITVNDLPATAGTINGATSICPGDVLALTDTTSGGVWSSSDVTVATVSATGSVTGVGAGSVDISYTITNSCGSTTTSATMTVNPIPDAGSISVAATSICPGATLTATDAATGGIWVSLDPSVASVDASGVITGLSTGSTIITYTVTNACGTAVASTPFDVLPAPALSAISGPTTICQYVTVSMTDSYFGGTWSSSDVSVATIDAATGSFTAITPGNTTVTYTATNIFSCTTTVTSDDTVAPAPDAGSLSGTTTNVCAGATISFTDGATGGTWSSTDISVATVDASGTVTGVSGGSATISYTASNSCGTVAATADITVNPAPSLSTITGPTTICTGVPSTLANSTFGGTWTSSDASVATVGASTGIVTGNAAGTVTISYTVTNIYGCSSVVTLDITVNPSADPGMLVVSTTTLCAGQAVSFIDTTSGGTWSSSNSAVATVDASGLVTSLTPGMATISYTVDNAFSCASSVTADVTVNPSPAVGAITGATSMCIGSTITLGEVSTGGSWSSADPSVATVDPSTGDVTGSSVGSTTISYTIMNAYGCSTSSVIADTVSAIPSSGTIGGPGSICTGTTVALTDAAAGGTWSSSNSAIATVDPSTGMTTGVTAGSVTISYIVYASMGCSTMATAAETVNLSPFVGAISGPSQVCERATAALSEPSAGGVWSSSDMSVSTVDASGVVTGVGAGMDTIAYTITDGVGCVSRSIFIDTVNPAPVLAAIGGPTDACLGSVITLTNSTSGGIWTSSSPSVAAVDVSGNVTGVTLGTATISYEVTNSFGCSTTVTATETVRALPTVSAISGATSVCASGTTTMVDATTGGVWTSSSTANATVNASTGVVTGVSGGATVISYTVTNIYNCPASATFNLAVNAGPSVAAITGTTSVCLGSTSTLADATGSGTWTSSTGSVATINTSGVVTSVSAGTTTITYAVVGTFGCVGVATTTVTVNALPTAAAIGGPSSVCMGSTITETNDTLGGTWTSSNTAVATVNASTGVVTGVAAGSTTISYTVTSGAGCAVIATTSVTVYPLPTVAAISGATGICIGGTTTLTDATASGVWSSSNTSVATINTSGSIGTASVGTTIISYTVTSTAGCVGYATMLFTVNSLPTGTLSPTSGAATLCNGDPVNLSIATVATAYQWLIGGSVLSGATNLNYLATTPGTYSVRLSNGGCTAVVSGVTVSAQPNPIILHGAGNTLYTGTFATYQWYKNGTMIPGATNNVVVITTTGSYTVVVSDGNGCTETSAVFEVTGVGVAGIVKADDIRLFPNPASSVITVEAPVKVNVSIMAPDGKVIIRTNNATSIDVSNFASGMYMIMIYSQDNELLKADKFIKAD